MVQIFKPGKKRKPAATAAAQRLLINDLNHHGDGVGRDRGQVIFVPGALPHEQVEVRIVERHKRFSQAELLKVITPSEDRREPFCAHYEKCGGCAVQHLAVAAQRKLKQQRLARVLADQHLPAPEEWVEPLYGDDTGYRRRARISIWHGKGANDFRVGFRQRGSKQIVQIERCPLLASALEDSFRLLRKLLLSLKRPKIFSHLEVCLANEGVLWVLRQLDEIRKDDVETLNRFAQQQQIILLLERQNGEVTKLDGSAAPLFHYSLNVSAKHLDIAFAPQHFIQVNHSVNQQMVEQAVSWLAPEQGEKIADLFAGVGNFSFALAASGASVIGVEGVSAMTQHGKATANALGFSHCHFKTLDLNGDIGEFAKQNGPFSAVLLDPARAGAQVVASQLGEWGVDRVVYVSCDPATLARDAALLCEQGYRIKRAGIIDMFPHTSHLESMLLFRKER